MVMSKSHVYKIINNINGKIYIGKANDPETRWNRHWYIVEYGENYDGFHYIHAALKKYGKKNFSFDVIEHCETEEEAFIREKNWIRIYQSNNRKLGYNLTSGGEGPSGIIKTDEEKRKNSEYMRKFWKTHPHPCIGRKLTEEHKKAIVAANTGRKHTDEAKEKISIANSGQNNGMYGRIEAPEKRIARGKKISVTKQQNPSAPHPISNETKEKLKIAVQQNLSRELTDEQRDQIVLLYATGNFLKRDLADKFDIEEKTIRYILRYWNEVKQNKSKYLTQEQKDTIIKLHSSKEHTYKKIAEKMDLPFVRIEAVIKMHQRKSKANKPV